MQIWPLHIIDLILLNSYVWNIIERNFKKSRRHNNADLHIGATKEAPLQLQTEIL